MRTSRWPSLLLGLLVGGLVFAGLWTITKEKAGYWTAQASAAVLPANADPTYDAIYYETLNSGQLVLTLTEVIRSAAAPPPGVTVEVNAVPQSSVIQITGRADTEQAAKDAAAQALQSGTAAITRLSIPYRLEVLTGDTPTTVEVAPSTLPKLVTAAGIAFIAALAVALGLPWMRKQLQG